MIITVSIFFSVVFVGVTVVPAFVCFLMHVFLWSMDECECSALAEQAAGWMLGENNFDLKPGEYDDQEGKRFRDYVKKVYWPKDEAVLAKTTIYAALIATIFSPMLVGGVWLAWHAYGGVSRASAVAKAYKFVYSVEGWVLPDLWGFLDVDWSLFWEVMASLADLIDIDPWKLLMASKFIFGIQTALGVCKVLMVWSNTALMCLTSNQFGLPPLPFAEVLKLQTKALAEGRDVTYLPAAIAEAKQAGLAGDDLEQKVDEVITQLPADATAADIADFFVKAMNPHGRVNV